MILPYTHKIKRDGLSCLCILKARFILNTGDTSPGVLMLVVENLLTSIRLQGSINHTNARSSI